MTHESRSTAKQRNSAVEETVTTQYPVNPSEVSAETGELQVASASLERIGRYEVERVLGSGGFGRVYLARDEELQRLVTIKVPHRHHIKAARDIDTFLSEARTLAKLEHANVVPVHDVGRTDDGLCYIVSRYVDGSDLTTRVKQSPLSVGESVELIAIIAEALHYVHTSGIVHRDIKPGNILLDKRGRPYVADFGLALKDDQFVRSNHAAGTPTYMSPEQTRGENHLMDGRSDVFSLGVVMYEILVGKRPFQGENTPQVFEQIQRHEPASLREINRNIPAELDRICIKALAKRAADRYQTALDFSADLRRFLSDDTGLSVVGSDIPASGEISGLSSSQELLGVAPKGLRSFEKKDAHFFFRLLPGARGRDGVPDSIRFWQHRITSPDPENSFRVGLIYGPSGCGKSSFVKAGLLPVLPESVIPVFIEAAPKATESRLLHRLRHQCPYLPTDLGLRESITSLRNRRVMGTDCKTLIVIDQFEQWLYSTDRQAHAELALALRQCDGENVQCILLVRDDFWLAVSRFMTDLEIELVQNRNMALVDLFDKMHARKVLAEFGQAFSKLPDHFSALNQNQMVFLDQAIDGLAEDDKVIPVRLSLFAEMVKRKPWTPATLKQIGGIAGVGLMFLDECFSSNSAPAEHRVHQAAVHATLKELLPYPGSKIKGSMRSRDELLAASGYEERPEEFDSLLRVLDSELRLITPTDPAGAVGDESESGKVGVAPHQYYQLTHDYLVPTIHDWLARRQRESRRGRAEIRLAERAEIWNARPDARHLPSYMEWLSILTLTKHGAWNDAQRRVMKAATRRYSILTIATTITLLLSAWGISVFKGFNEATSLTQQLATSSVAEVPRLLDELDKYHRLATDQLRAVRASAAEGTRSHTYSSLALLRRDPGLADQVSRGLFTADPETLAVLRDELEPFRDRIVPGLWQCLADKNADQAQRLNAAFVLSSYDRPQADKDHKRWNEHGTYVADWVIDFANKDRDSYRTMLDLIYPTRSVLIDRISEVFVDQQEKEVRRLSAAGLLVDLLRDEPRELTNRFLDADVELLQLVLPTIDEQRNEVRGVLVDAVASPLEPSQSRQDRIRRAYRKAIAAALLLRHDVIGDEITGVFQSGFTADARSLLIHRVRPLGVRPDLLAEMLQAQSETSIRQGLMQALGEFDKDELSQDWQLRTEQLVKGWFRSGSDGGLHSCSRWLLQRWGEEDWLETTSNELSGQPTVPGRNWYMNSERHLMLRIPNDRPAGKNYVIRSEHDYMFDIASAEVTLKQFQRFKPSKQSDSDVPLDLPAVRVNWHTAVAYCNWLTRQEGLGTEQLCYPDWNEGDPAVELYPDFRNRTGYRLPTMEEWMAAYRCGTQTTYFFGDDKRRLEGYVMLAPESGQRLWPSGNKKPNFYGLFDMATNAIEWVSDARKDTKRGVVRGLCGDHYHADFSEFEPSRTVYDSPTLSWTMIGFRVARSATPAEQ